MIEFPDGGGLPWLKNDGVNGMLVAPCTGSQSSKRAHQDGDSASENASAETGLGEVSPSDTVGGSVIAGAGGFARDLDDFFPIKIHWGQLGVLEIGVPG